LQEALLFVFIHLVLYAQSPTKEVSAITIAPQLTGNIMVPVGVFNEVSPFGVQNLFLKTAPLRFVLVIILCLKKLK